MSTYLTYVRLTPRGTSFSDLQAVEQAWQPMQRLGAVTLAHFTGGASAVVTERYYRVSVGDKVLRPVIREDVLRSFPALFGTKTVNGRSVDVDATMETLTRELRPEIAAALSARRTLLQSP